MARQRRRATGRADQPADQSVDGAERATRSGLRLGFMQGEYNSIRAELVAALSTQQTVMTYGLAAMAVMFTGLLSTWANLAIRIGILSLAPLILLFIWFVWFGEALRLIRARWFIWELEQRINAELREPDELAHDTLNWESWVRGRNRWGRNLHSRPAYHLRVSGLAQDLAQGGGESVRFAGTAVLAAKEPVVAAREHRGGACPAARRPRCPPARPPPSRIPRRPR